MAEFRPFAMERWQSKYENRVRYNLSESGVHPLTVRELLALGDTTLDDVLLGYGQSNGSDPLRDAIAQLYRGGAESGVVVTNGSAEANFVALWELLEPGAAAAIVVPTYMQTPGLAENLGAHVIELPLHEKRGWQVDPDEVRRLVTSEVRALVITNPNNPTGARLTRESRDALTAAAARVGAWIVADEVYTGAELDAQETSSFFGTYERVIATGSLSKAYGLPGLRIGWVMTEPAMAERLWARTDYTTIAPGELTDRLARVALDDTVRPRLRERTRAIIQDGLAVLEPHLARWGCSWRRPDAGAICYARYPWAAASAGIAERLRVEQDVLLVPGTQFGNEGWLRFGIGLLHDEHTAALERVDRLVATLGARAPMPV
ncbi:MAG TPA: aminotransferase class I/II-fold pyridoxal phosphate-dependent enzyme [Longimicrobiales bacterium]|nr:aminotransferase class I/II-fold pyridoxal phosphate-dependent enzyme [Longimicrobiales bacterium]